MMTARFARLGVIGKFLSIAVIAGLLTLVFPSPAAAQTNLPANAMHQALQAKNKTLTVFEINNFQQISKLINLLSTPDNNQKTQESEPVPNPNIEILKDYLAGKGSPLAGYSEHLLKQTNWKLVVAISNGESTMCKRQLYNNCWGIGGAWNLKRYSSLEESITDAGRLLTEKYVTRGADTPKEIVSRYVGWDSPNWVLAANQILDQLNQLPLQN